MSPPSGFEESFGVRKVCKLKKSLYGLKRSPRAWFERFGKVIKHYGYTQSQADHTMFYKHSNEGKVAILIVYVDDIVLTGDDCNELEKLKGKLVEEFEIKDLGALKYFLGMEFARSKEGIFVNQGKYVLIFLMRQDSKVSKGTPGRGLLFKSRGHLQIETYTDADWVGSIVDRRSTSGYCSFVGGNLVTWRSKKQNVVARSSAKAEFRAVAHGNNFSSSQSVLHDRTKHVEVDKHFIKEKIDNGLVCMTYIPTEEQVVDVFTKGLHKRQFDFLVGKLAMEDIFKPT
ncbi:Retrovirus-related Pol polyprotein from transposon TNT 1-94 [Vitis vinifera]|uniref:Retrovirus-related Pol polyprotein from transposon TNT 1-94 n=1 Tax=Vitis vinifera TaxID=29760 RepID=A0A438CP87_VITVI|nr:Retrovirus-related Pol polyprotein from transposon TNT 1-94 [Vitis vinifera]